MPADPTLFALFGAGYLTMTFDQVATGERYQGIVPLDGETLADAVQSYFYQSDQIPTLVRIARDRGIDGTIAGGLFLQHLPEGEEGRDRIHTRLDHPEWEQIAALGQTVEAKELCDADLNLETLVWRLFNEEDEVRLQGDTRLSRGCRCSPDYIEQVLAKFPEAERREMADDHGMIAVDCAFCAKKFAMPVAA